MATALGGKGGVKMRGYFGIGAERISKPMNLGAILRTGHAFGASFVYSVAAHHKTGEIEFADTAKTAGEAPYYDWADLGAMRLPKGCALVGVELCDEAIELPSFRHPLNAAYLLGPEKGDLSDDAQALCEHIVRIPTKFCVNLSVAAAIVMYDRLLALGGFPVRPVGTGGPPPSDGWQAPRKA